MKYSKLLSYLHNLARITGISPYPSISSNHGNKRLKLSLNSRQCLFFYNIVFLLLSAAFVEDALSSFSTTTVGNTVTSIYRFIWILTFTGLQLNQINNFRFLKKPLLFILNTGEGKIEMSMRYIVALMIYFVFLIGKIAILPLGHHWNNYPVITSLTFLMNCRAVYSIAITTVLLHVITKYISLNLELICDELRLSIVGQYNNMLQLHKNMTESDCAAVVKMMQPGGQQSSKKMNIVKLNQCVRTLSEVVRIKKVIQHLQKYFKIPVILLTMWAQVILIGNLLICIGLRIEDNLRYRSVDVCLQLSGICFLVDSQELYYKIVCTSRELLSIFLFLFYYLIKYYF